MKQALHIVVQGRVQGVYFRANTRKQAIRLGLTGMVRNLPDNSVEIIACGNQQALQQLVTWCHKGPLLAKVSAVISQPYAGDEGFESFEIL